MMGSTVLANVLDLYRSGANPQTVSIAQQREMLMKLHHRLENYDHALNVLMAKVDALPGLVRRLERRHERRALHRDVEAAVRAIRTSVSGAERTGMSAGYAHDQLQTLEQAAYKLLTIRDGMSMPYYVLALQTEMALYNGLNTRGDEEALWKFAWTKRASVTTRCFRLSTGHAVKARFTKRWSWRKRDFNWKNDEYERQLDRLIKAEYTDTKCWTRFDQRTNLV